MSPARVIAAIFGVLFAPAAIGLLVGGIALVAVFAANRDDDGYVRTTAYELASDGYAITSDDIDISPYPGDWWPSGIATARFTIAADNGPVFFGIGPADEIGDYLEGVAVDRVDRLGFGADDVRYRGEAGGAPPGPPAEQGFWEISASTGDEQTLTWEVESGSWGLALMNADGSAGVSATVRFGVRIPVLIWIGVGMIIGGVILGGLAAGLLVFAFAAGGGATRGLPAPALSGRSAADTPYPVLFEARIDEPLSRWMWLVKWILAIPHYIILAFLWVAFVLLTIVAFFAILFTGRYPRGIFDFNVGVLRWWWRVIFYSTSVLATDRYPPFSLADDPDYPARFDVAYPEQLSQGLVLVKWWLLAIPHYIIISLFTSGLVWWTTDLGNSGDRVLEIGGGILGILTLIAALILLFSGRYSRPMFDILVGINRWIFRVIAYATLMRDEYPPFRLDLGGNEPHGPVPTAGVYDPAREENRDVGS